MPNKVRIRQKKSAIGYSRRIRETLKSLGLRKIGDVVEKELTPSVEGMIRKVEFLVEVEKI